MRNKLTVIAVLFFLIVGGLALFVVGCKKKAPKVEYPVEMEEWLKKRGK